MHTPPFTFVTEGDFPLIHDTSAWSDRCLMTQFYVHLKPDQQTGYPYIWPSCPDRWGPWGGCTQHTYWL